MMVVLVSWLCAFLQDGLQVALMLLLAPVLCWGLEEVPQWLAGKAVVSAGGRLRRHLAFWRNGLKNGFPGRDGICLTMVLLVLAALPAITVGIAAIVLSDPLVLGILLLAVRGCVVLPVRSCISEGRFSGNLRTGVRPLVSAFVVLCLTEALIALAAPGADGLGGLCEILHIEPAQGLEGALAACALALGIACPLLRPEDVSLLMGHLRLPDERESRRMIVDILNTVWILFLSDLALPSGIAVPGSGLAGWSEGLVALAGRLWLVSLALLGSRMTGQELSARLTALFAGLALLVALSGRFAT